MFSRIWDSRGAGLVEGAIISPLLFLITFSIMEFGTMMYVHLALVNGVSQATRFAVTGQLVPGQNLVDSIKSTMRQATPTLTIPDAAFSFSHIPPGGSTWVGGAGGPDAIGRLTVTYSWPILTPLLRPFFSADTVTFVVVSAMKNEGQIQL